MLHISPAMLIGNLKLCDLDLQGILSFAYSPLSIKFKLLVQTEAAADWHAVTTYTGQDKHCYLRFQS